MSQHKGTVTPPADEFVVVEDKNGEHGSEGMERQSSNVTGGPTGLLMAHAKTEPLLSQSGPHTATKTQLTSYQKTLQFAANSNAQLLSALEIAVEVCSNSVQAKKLAATKNQLVEMVDTLRQEAVRLRHKSTHGAPTFSHPQQYMGPHAASSLNVSTNMEVDGDETTTPVVSFPPSPTRNTVREGSEASSPAVLSPATVFQLSPFVVEELAREPVSRVQIAKLLHSGVFGVMGVETPRLKKLIKDVLAVIVVQSLGHLAQLLPYLMQAPGYKEKQSSLKKQPSTNGSANGNQEATSSVTASCTMDEKGGDLFSDIVSTVLDLSECVRQVFTTLSTTCNPQSTTPLSDDGNVRQVLRICTESLRMLSRIALVMQVNSRRLQTKMDFLRGQVARNVCDAKEELELYIEGAEVAAEFNQMTHDLVEGPLKFMLAVVSSPGTIVATKTRTDTKTIMFQLMEALTKQASEMGNEPMFEELPLASLPLEQREEISFPPFLFAFLSHLSKQAGDVNEAQLLCVKLVSDCLSVLAVDDPFTFRNLMKEPKFSKDILLGALICIVSVHSTVTAAGLSILESTVKAATVEAAQECGFIYCNCVLRLLDSDNSSIENKLAIVNHILRTSILPETSRHQAQAGTYATIEELEEAMGLRQPSTPSIEEKSSNTNNPKIWIPSWVKMPSLLLQLYYLFDLDTQLHHLNFVQHVASSFCRIVRVRCDELGAQQQRANTVKDVNAGGAQSSTTATSSSSTGSEVVIEEVPKLATAVLASLVSLIESVSTTLADISNYKAKHHLPFSPSMSESVVPPSSPAPSPSPTTLFPKGNFELSSKRIEKQSLQRAVDVVNSKTIKGMMKLFSIPEAIFQATELKNELKRAKGITVPETPVSPEAMDNLAKQDSSAATTNANQPTPEELVEMAHKILKGPEITKIHKIVNFLLYTPSLNPLSIGEFVSDQAPYATACCIEYFRNLPLRGKSLTSALSEVLSVLQLPKEGQKIERLLEQVAHVYFDFNQGITNKLNFPFVTKDSTFLVTVATVMLNTNLHNPNVSVKMTKKDFCIQIGACAAPDHPFPVNFASDLFETISHAPLSNVKGIGAANPESSSHVSTSLQPQTRMDLLFFSKDERKELMFGLERQRIVMETKELVQRRARKLKRNFPPPECIAKDLFITTWPSLLAVFSVTMQHPSASVNVQLDCVQGLQHCLLASAILGLLTEMEATFMTLLRLGSSATEKVVQSHCLKAVLFVASSTHAKHFNSACWNSIVTILADVKRGQLGEALSNSAENVYKGILALMTVNPFELHETQPVTSEEKPGETCAVPSPQVLASRNPRPYISANVVINAVLEAVCSISKHDAASLSAHLFVLKRMLSYCFLHTQSSTRLYALWRDVLNEKMLFLTKLHQESEECVSLVIHALYSLLTASYCRGSELEEEKEEKGGDCNVEPSSPPGSHWSTAAKPFQVLIKVFHCCPDSTSTKLELLKGLQNFLLLRKSSPSKTTDRKFAREQSAVNQLHWENVTLWENMTVLVAHALSEARSTGSREIAGQAALILRSLVESHIGTAAPNETPSDESDGKEEVEFSSSLSKTAAAHVRSAINQLLVHLCLIGAFSQETSVALPCVTLLHGIASTISLQKSNSSTTSNNSDLHNVEFESFFANRLVATLRVEPDSVRSKVIETLRFYSETLRSESLLNLAQMLCGLVMELVDLSAGGGGGGGGPPVSPNPEESIRGPPSTTSTAAGSRRYSLGGSSSVASSYLSVSSPLLTPVEASFTALGFLKPPRGFRVCNFASFSSTLPVLLEVMGKELVHAKHSNSKVGLYSMEHCFIPVASHSKMPLQVRSLSVQATISSASAVLQKINQEEEAAAEKKTKQQSPAVLKIVAEVASTLASLLASISIPPSVLLPHMDSSNNPNIVHTGSMVHQQVESYFFTQLSQRVALHSSTTGGTPKAHREGGKGFATGEGHEEEVASTHHNVLVEHQHQSHFLDESSIADRYHLVSCAIAAFHQNFSFSLFRELLLHSAAPGTQKDGIVKTSPSPSPKKAKKENVEQEGEEEVVKYIEGKSVSNLQQNAKSLEATVEEGAVAAWDLLDLFLLAANMCVLMEQCVALQNSKAFSSRKSHSSHWPPRAVLQRALGAFFSLAFVGLSGPKKVGDVNEKRKGSPKKDERKEGAAKQSVASLNHPLQQKVFKHSLALFKFYSQVPVTAPQLKAELALAIKSWCAQVYVQCVGLPEPLQQPSSPTSHPSEKELPLTTVHHGPSLLWEVMKHPTIFYGLVTLLTAGSGPVCVAAVQLYLKAFHALELVGSSEEDEEKLLC